MAIYNCLEGPQRYFCSYWLRGLLEVGKSRSCTYTKEKWEAKEVSEEIEGLPNLEAPGSMEHSQLPTASPRGHTRVLLSLTMWSVSLPKQIRRLFENWNASQLPWFWTHMLKLLSASEFLLNAPPVPSLMSHWSTYQTIFTGLLVREPLDGGKWILLFVAFHPCWLLNSLNVDLYRWKKSWWCICKILYT